MWVSWSSERGLLLEKRSSEKAEVRPAALEKCSALTHSVSGPQSTRQTGNNLRKGPLTTPIGRGVNYRKCSSTAPFVFMTCGTADTTGNLIPQMQLCADCTYLKDYNFPIRTECFLPFPGKRSVPLCLVLQALRHVIVRCKSRCA